MSRGVYLKEVKRNGGRITWTQAKHCFRNKKRVNGFQKESLSSDAQDPDILACLYNPCILPETQYTESFHSLQTTYLPWCIQLQTTKVPISNKVEGQGWFQGLSSDLHVPARWCTYNIHIHVPVNMHTNKNKNKSHTWKAKKRDLFPRVLDQTEWHPEF